MTEIRHGSDNWMRDLTARLPREDPPELSLQAIVDLGRRRARKRATVFGGIVASTALLLAIALGGDREPPVHLDIQIVDVLDPPDADPETAAWFGAPEEAKGP